MDRIRPQRGHFNRTTKDAIKREMHEKCWVKTDPDNWCELYFIGAWIGDDLVAVKIGISKDCLQRLESLQSQTFADLSVVGYFTYTSVALARELEKQAHTDLAEYRIRGEWFRPEPAVLNYNPLFL